MQILLCSVQQEPGVIGALVLGMPVRQGDLDTSGVMEGVRGTQTGCAGEVHDGDRQLHGRQGGPRNTKGDEDDAGHDSLARLAAEKRLHIQREDPKLHGSDK